MPSIKSVLFWLSIGLVLSFGLFNRLLGNGIPATHDGPIHVVRMVSYYTALQQGQLPPRWGPNLANGLGYPVLNFNYPLANILAVGFLRFHISYTLVYQLITLVSVLVGVVGICMLMRSFSAPWWVQCTVGSIYVAHPFMTSHLFVRGGIGETVFIGLVPWVLFFIRRSILSPLLYWQLLLGLSGGMLALSHNVLVLFSIPFLLFFTIWQSWNRWEKSAHLLIPVLIAFLLSAFFWIPALAEKNQILVDNSSFMAQYADHFLSWSELLTGTFGYGFSRPGPVDGFTFSISTVELVSLILCFSWSLAAIKKRYGFMFSVLGLVLILWLTTTSSATFWHFIPLGPYIQFPWRLLWFFHLGCSVLIGFWLMRIAGRITKWVVISLLMVSVMQTYQTARPQYRVDRSAEEWLRAGETTNTLNENSPKTFSMGTAYQIINSEFGDRYVWTSTSSAAVTVHFWDGSKRTYSLTTPIPTTVVERTAFFTGWETRIDGQLIESTSNDPWHAGLITYIIPAGSHAITTQFTQHTMFRMIGNGLSVVGMVIVIGLSMLQGYQYAHKK